MRKLVGIFGTLLAVAVVTVPALPDPMGSAASITTTKADRGGLVVPGTCAHTLVDRQAEQATTVAVKTIVVCPEDQAALEQARAEGIVDPEAPPEDHAENP